MVNQFHTPSLASNYEQVMKNLKSVVSYQLSVICDQQSVVSFLISVLSNGDFNLFENAFI